MEQPTMTRYSVHSSIRRIGLSKLNDHILAHPVDSVENKDRYLNYLLDKYEAGIDDSDEPTEIVMRNASSQRTTSETFPLMTLPVEIRWRIYQLAFTDSKVTVDAGGTLRARYYSANRQLLQSTSRIRSEALGLFAACTELTYYGGDLECVRLVTPPGFLESVRRLKCLFFSPVGNLLMKLPSLRVLEVEFRHTGVINDMPTGPGMNARCDELLVQLVRSDSVLRQGWPAAVIANQSRKFVVLVSMELSHQRYAEPFVRVWVDLDTGTMVRKEEIRGS